ncbi:hypothetical protein KCU86_g25390, partial [Aureobasidium melanogenum]
MWDQRGLQHNRVHRTYYPQRESLLPSSGISLNATMPAMLDDPTAPAIYRASGDAPYPTPYAPLP